MISGVIFDVDGVILDTMPMWHTLGLRYLEKLGIHAEYEICDTLFAMSMEEGASYLKNTFGLQFDETRIIDGLISMIEDFYTYNANAKCGASELIKKLAEKNIPIVAATSSDGELVKAALGRIGVLGYFKDIITTAEIGKSKHSPEVYRAAAKIIGSEKSTILVFEDSLYALETAKKDGFITVGVRDDGGEKNQAGLKNTADYYVNSLDEFLQLQ